MDDVDLFNEAARLVEVLLPKTDVSQLPLSASKLLTTTLNTGRMPPTILATFILPTAFGTKDTSVILATDEDFLDDKVTIDRGRSVGTLCFVFSELPDGVSSEGIG